MDIELKDPAWEALSYAEKNRQLFLKQEQLLATFLEHGTISQAQHDKSLHDLKEKMGIGKDDAGSSNLPRSSKNSLKP